MYNILDDTDIDDIQSDPAFQQIASKIICSDLDNYGFRVCHEGLSRNTAASGTPEGDGAGQTNSPFLDGTDPIFNDSNEEENDNSNNDNDNEDDNDGGD